MRRFILIIVALLISMPAFAQDKSVTTDLASDHVDITTGFNGTTIEVFGVRHNGGNIAVVVRGPERTMSVRRKESVMGAWMNRTFESFKKVPAYYNVAVSVPLEKMAAKEVLIANGIGTENLQFNKPDSTDGTRILFRQALLRNKQKQGLFAEKAGELKFISDDFFRADFYIPSNVSVGEYQIQTFYFKNGQVQDSEIKTLRVAQVGGSARIHEFAHKNSFIYGVLCVALAIFAGWFSNKVRRG